MKRVLPYFLLGALAMAGSTACSGPAVTAGPPGAAGPPVVAGQSRPLPNPEPSAPAGASPDALACGVVTLGEVSTATGRPMKLIADAVGQCYFTDTADGSVAVTLSVLTTQENMKVYKEAEDSSNHLPGLGDDAFWTPVGMIFAQQGSRAIAIVLPPATQPTEPDLAAKARLITLAKAALGRL